MLWTLVITLTWKHWFELSKCYWFFFNLHTNLGCKMFTASEYPLETMLFLFWRFLPYVALKIKTQTVQKILSICNIYTHMQCGTAAKGPQDMLGCWYNCWLSSKGDLQGTSVVFSDSFSDLTHARGTPTVHHTDGNVSSPSPRTKLSEHSPQRADCNQSLHQPPVWTLSCWRLWPELPHIRKEAGE